MTKDDVLKSGSVAMIVSIAEEAGRRTLEYYGREIDVDYKDDASPLTQADRESHALIARRLKDRFPDIPLVSEEGAIPAYSERAGFACFWLVDPLDGTKEFIKANGEYTVNIALIADGRPILGVVSVPCQEKVYWATHQGGAFLKHADQGVEKLHSRSDRSAKGLSVAVSRSHGSTKIDDFLHRLEDPHLMRVGSALKFCLLAEGKIDCYPRFGPIMEWDTAAAHLVAEESGGDVRQFDGTPLCYNKPKMIHPDGFLVSHSPQLADVLIPLARKAASGS